MFVCVFVDELNESLGVDSIDDNRQIVCVSNDINKIKQHISEQEDGSSTVNWQLIEERWIGVVVYDDEIEDRQHYVICQVMVV